jgi:F-type H+-transporting ATPase subunit gamma
MSDTTSGLRRQISSAHELGTVVRALKAMAASSIARYEAAVQALDDYERSIELGLSLCLRQQGGGASRATTRQSQPIRAVVFGSDQGLVGRFNETVAELAVQTLSALPQPKQVWVVGERVIPQLEDAGLAVTQRFVLPSSIDGIAALIARIQLRVETGVVAPVHVFHNRPLPAAQYEPVSRKLLPLDDAWRARVTAIPWPGKSLPQMLGGASEGALAAFVHEHLFIALYKACAQSLAAENSSRLAAMQRAQKNIEDLSITLGQRFNRTRQSSIDAELFDVIAGFSALS